MLALFVALVGFGWQVLSYRLSGARLQVRIIPALMTVNGGVFRFPQSGRSKQEPPARFTTLATEPAVELAVIEVINVGRLPVSISNVALDLGIPSVRRPWQRLSRAGHPVAVADGKPAAERGDEPVRLEVGERYSVFMYVPEVVPCPAPKSIRATALPAGGRAKRSPWPRRWRAGGDFPRCRHGRNDSVNQQLLDAVFPLVKAADPLMLLNVYLAVGGMCRTQSTVDYDDAFKTLRSSLGEAATAYFMLAHNAATEIERLAPLLKSAWDERDATEASDSQPPAP